VLSTFSELCLAFLTYVCLFSTMSSFSDLCLVVLTYVYLFWLMSSFSDLGSFSEWHLSWRTSTCSHLCLPFVHYVYVFLLLASLSELCLPFLTYVYLSWPMSSFSEWCPPLLNDVYLSCMMSTLSELCLLYSNSFFGFSDFRGGPCAGTQGTYIYIYIYIIHGWVREHACTRMVRSHMGTPVRGYTCDTRVCIWYAYCRCSSAVCPNPQYMSTCIYIYMHICVYIFLHGL
jgi:hypothetical protein